MAPLPKRRHSTRRSGQRKAERRLSAAGIVKCPQCGALKLPHRVCQNCGYYAGKTMVVVKEKKQKRD